MLSLTVLNSLHSTDAIRPQYWCYLPTCTDAISPQYCSYPSSVLNSLHSTVLSPHMYCSYPSAVLNSPRSTDDIPPQYWCYPPAVLMLFPHSTEQPPQYWCYPHMYWCYPPQYWTASAVLNRRYTGWQRGKWCGCITKNTKTNRNSKEWIPNLMRNNGLFSKILNWL